MAAATSTFVAASVASLPSSVSAFRNAGAPVQHVPVASLRSTRGCGRLVVARASSEEPQKFPIRREILAGILVAGAVLSSTGPVLADPLADVKSKFEETVSSVQGSAGKAAGDVKGKVSDSSVSSLPDAGDATGQVKGKIDGIFGGKNKGPPFKFDALGIGKDAKEAVTSKVDEAKQNLPQ